MTEDQIKHMVDRFLAWNLPRDFNPDAGISYTRPGYHPDVDDRAILSGTNLFGAAQATAMVRYMVEGLPSETPSQPPQAGVVPVAWREVEVMRLIDLLRSAEGDSVTLICDNPDFNGQPNCAVICNGDWTHWKDRRFAADTLLDALSLAVTEYRLPAERPVVAESNGHHWVQAFSMVCCRDCGMVRRGDDQNKPCKGVVRIGLRSAPPVAWRYRWKLEGEWVNWRVADHTQKHDDLKDLEEIPLYTAPPAALLVREALERAEKYFELIRLKLINHLNEPERSAFWTAVEARDAMHAALSSPHTESETSKETTS